MKKLFFLSALALCLSACDKSSDNAPEVKKEGVLALGVTASEPQQLSRATAVSTDNFPVTIEGKGAAAGIKYSYNTAKELPTSLSLPVGTYNITAHTPCELLKKMDAPYYKGSDDVEIMAGITNRHNLECRMANSRIRMVLTDAYLKQFGQWTITINDEKELVFNETSQYNDIFWLFEEGTKTLKVDVKAVTKDGNSVYSTNIYTKEACDEGYKDIENDCFTGGDAITLKFEPATDPNGVINDVTITASITFANDDEIVDVVIKDHVTPDVPDDPDPPTPPTPSGDIEVNFVNGSSFDIPFGQESGYPDVQVGFKFPTGLRNLYVKVKGSVEFEFACSLMGLTDGDGLDLASDKAKELAQLFNLPKAGDKEYSFSFNETLWSLLTVSPGYPGKQVFTLKAVDNNGKEKSGELTINVTQ